jgi:predicted dienelactone hydrolase
MPVVRFFVLCIAAILLTACSTDSAEKPSVKPLQTSQAELQKIYGFTKGELAVVSMSSAIMNEDGDEVPLKIWFPEAKGSYPLLVFSHGNWSDQTKYDNVITHWVSHGYVVAAPYHLDGGGMARGIFNSVRYGQLGLIENRAKTLSQVIDSLPALELSVENLAGKINYNIIGATGHSFGGYSAQMLAGASAFDPDQNKHLFFIDERITAVVAISPPGKMFDVIVGDSWQQVSKPMLVATGTWDSNPQFWPDWRDHLLSYDTAVSGNNYSLVVQGADHYLGNLICRPEREEAPQTDALNMVNAVSVTFLDAKLKNNLLAIAALEVNQLASVTNNFAVIETR